MYTTLAAHWYGKRRLDRQVFLVWNLFLKIYGRGSATVLRRLSSILDPIEHVGGRVLLYGILTVALIQEW